MDETRAGGVVARHLAGSPEGGWLEPGGVQEILLAYGLPVLRTVVAADPAHDRAALLDMIVRVGRLAETQPEVVELDLKPVVLGAAGCDVVDARIRVAPAGDPALRALG